MPGYHLININIYMVSGRVLQVWNWETTLQPPHTLILHLTFGYHQLGISRPILDSLETVWDRAVSPPPPVLRRRLSHPAFPLGQCTNPRWPHSVLFIRPRPRPCGSGSGSLASYLCPLRCSAALWRFTSKAWRVFLWVGTYWPRQWCLCGKSVNSAGQ